MNSPFEETIAAIATPPGEGGIAVLRLSGDRALAIAAERFRGTILLSDAKGRTAHVGGFVGHGGETVDEVVCTVFRAPHSYTGEDVVEISCHGGALITRQILETLLASGARPAEPGEFTRRAFLNGRIDLSQAEAVADLIRSRSDAARRASLRQLKGGLSERIGKLRDGLVTMVGLLELELDFAEDGYEFADRTKLRSLLEEELAGIRGLLATYSYGRVWKEGVRVVLTGAPNVGKSSLLNALLEEERAIVTPIPGTTRDVIEDSLTISGLLFRIFDTAGVRSSHDPVEKEGIRRTEVQVKSADIILLVLDGSRPVAEEDTELARMVLEPSSGNVRKVVVVVNKSDILLSGYRESLRQLNLPPKVRIIETSAVTGSGMESLRKSMLDELSLSLETGGEEQAVAVTSARHYSLIMKSGKSLEDALEGIKKGLTGELIALDLRSALDSLGEIVGAVTTNDILNSIFAQFCIGK